MIKISMKRRLLGSTIVAGLALAASPALAQNTSASTPDPTANAPGGAAVNPPAQTTAAPTDATGTSDAGAIVVTGSLFKTAKETPSPVTTLTTDDLAKRGIQTVQAAIQSIASNNGPALTNSFTANGAFAAGASSVSLRGLTTNSTLVLFDGLRAAYYPIADDGTRNFVDLNTIPDEIVDHIEVLDDGASSTYGADAIAGVINIITKKTIKGFHATTEAGITERKDFGNQRVSATYGYGDLDEQGFNVYVSGHYIHSAELKNSDRGYPYNTANLTGICYQGVCGPNNIQNGIDSGGNYAGLATQTTVPLVRPYNAANTTALGPYQLLNPAAGCRDLTAYTLTAAQRTASAPPTVCQQDNVNKYGIIEPEQTRYGGSAHFVARVGDRAEFTTELNYERSEVHYTGAPATIYGSANAGIDFPSYSTSSASAAHAAGSGPLTLPVYVCPERVNCATAADRTLNPNNPFAALGEVARLIGALPDSQTYNQTISQAYRAAMGLHGSFGDNWNYAIDGTAMVNVLDTTDKGYVYIQHLLDEIADGSYNFVNPAANTQATLSYLQPTLKLRDTSHEYQGQASLSKDFFQLPGGPLEVAVGGSVRYESVNDPSGNPDYAGPTQRYFTLNAFGAAGHRYVESGYFEINAPVLNQLTINGSGRYDHYSTGNSNFSPKIGAIFTPIKQFSVRGTFSKGFRIPSFGEANSLPTTGFVTVSPASLPAAFVAQHLTAGGTPDAYLTSYSLGETTLGNPNLKPEKSTSYTLGGIFTPVPNLTLKVTYYNIEKKHAITGADLSPAIAAYYAGGAIPAGYTVTPDAVDPDHPNSMARLAFVSAGFVNANTIKTSGLQFDLAFRHRFSDKVSFESSGEAAYIIKLNTTFPDGSVEKYAGTLGNFNLTAGSGTFRWKANWQNTLTVGKTSLSATAYYTSGYNLSAEDQEGPGTAGDCGLDAGYQACNVKRFIDVDMTLNYKVNDNFNMYVNVLNVGDAKSPLDTVTYGGYLYNPVQSEAGIIGRAFRVGANFGF